MKNKRLLHIIILLLLLQFILPSASSLAIDVAPRISDREIIEKLVTLEAGQKSLNQRISDLRSEMKAGQASLDKRLDDLGKRIDDSNSTMLAFFGAIITLIVALFVYIAWDRRTMFRPVVTQLNQLERDVVNDLELRHSQGSLLTRQLKVLRLYARQNSEFAEIMRDLSLLQREEMG